MSTQDSGRKVGHDERVDDDQGKKARWKIVGPGLVVAATMLELVAMLAIRHIGRGPSSVLGRSALHFYEHYCEGVVAFNYGFNVGFNPQQTILPGYFATYRWYAGQIVYDDSTNAFTAVPTEFGGFGL